MNKIGAQMAMTLAPLTGETTMRIRDIVADAIGAVLLFVGGYGLLVLLYGFGW